MRRILIVLVTAALLCAGFGAPPPAAAQTLSDVVNSARNAGAGLFGSSEFRARSLEGLPQWRRVLETMARDRQSFERCAADAAQCGSAALRSWREAIRTAAPLDKAQRLRAINQFFNRWPYKTDREVYGRREYWASPGEFMTYSGDCEDYSIAKFFALRALGFGNEEMRIVVLWDEIRAIGHAVLAVSQADDVVILDSLSDFIVSHTRYKHYIPQVSMNETERWAHINRGKKLPPHVAARD